MKRPIQHEIDSIAKRIFCSQLPKEWVEREQVSDYGIDYELEVFRNGNSTGLIAKVQLKGTSRLKINNDFVIFPLKTANIHYLLFELRIPTFLFVVDIHTTNIYWLNLKSDNGIRNSFNISLKTRKKTIFLKIPKSNVFLSSINMFPSEIENAYKRIGFECFNTIDNESFLEILNDSSSIENLTKATEEKLDLLYLKKLSSLIDEGKLFEVDKESKELIQRNKNKPENVVNILIIWELAFNNLLNNSKVDEQQQKLMKLNFAHQYIENLPRKNINLKYYCLMNYHTKLLSYLCFLEMGVYTSTQISIGNDPFYQMFVKQGRMDFIKKIHKEYNYILKLIRYQLNRNDFNRFFPGSIYELVDGISHLIFRITYELGNDIKDDNFLGHINTLIDIGVLYSVKNNHFDGVITGKITKIKFWGMVDKEKSLKILNDFYKELENLNFKNKEDILNFLSVFKNTYLLNKEPVPVSLEDEKRIIRQMAAGLGINLNDPEDEIAKIVNIGIKDLDPTRVLKNCKFLFLHITSYGIPAQMLNLPTAGSKMLNCTKHGYGMGSLDLDSIYASFKENYCQNCRDKKPQNKKWLWSRELQKEQEELNKDLLKRGLF